jgi:hypothetical protein
MPARPRIPKPIGRPPTRNELLDMLDAIETAAAEMVGRWWNGIAAEVRVELDKKIRTPALRMLIRARRRPRPR